MFQTRSLRHVDALASELQIVWAGASQHYPWTVRVMVEAMIGRSFRSSVGQRTGVPATCRKPDLIYEISGEFRLLPERFSSLCIASPLGRGVNDTGGGMAAGDGYRVKARELLARAHGENDQTAKAELENLAVAFLRLAEQAERNAALTIEFELPSGEEDNSKPK